MQSAEFTPFALSPGDTAQLSLTPIQDGYQVRIRGDQLDLKPMLKRFFSLGEGSGGPAATTFTQPSQLDAELKRALGYYRTTAFNVDLDLALKGSDLRKVSMQAQLGNDKSCRSPPIRRTGEADLRVQRFGIPAATDRRLCAGEGGEGSLVLDRTPAPSSTSGFQLQISPLSTKPSLNEMLESGRTGRKQRGMCFRRRVGGFVQRSTGSKSQRRADRRHVGGKA